MGMDQKSIGMLQQGLGFVENFVSQVNGTNEQGGMLETAANEQGGMLEIDAKGKALDAQGRARKNAKDVRSQQEGIRARRNTGWGKSNLAMSGSKKLVRDGGRIKDHQAEEDILFEGQVDADEILNDGRHRANMLRIDGGATPMRSTLSLGSKIYGPRR